MSSTQTATPESTPREGATATRLRYGTSDLFLTALAATFLAATLHLGAAAFQRHVVSHDPWNWSGRDTAWMLALGYALAYVPLAAVLWAARSILSRLVTPTVVVFGFSTAVTFSVLLLFSSIASAAWLLVALGVGVQVAAVSRRHRRMQRRMVRAMALSGLIVYPALGLWSTFGREWRSNALLSALQPTPGARSVLLIILDTVRSDDIGVFGAQRPTTPTIDSLAAHAVLFDNAIATSSWTLPSHASMFTGLWASQHGADWLAPLEDGVPTIAEAFRDAGFATGGFTANLIATGFGSGLGRGFLTYRDTRRTVNEIALHSTLAQGRSVVLAIERITTSRWYGGAARALLQFDFRPISAYQSHHRKPGAVVTDEFLEWQRKLGGRPFFAFLNYFDAHAPYQSPLDTLFNAGRTQRDRHDGAVRYVDGEIDRLLRALRQNGSLDDCIIVITSDHGEQFGEHGLRGHGNSLYGALLRVPLILSIPAQAQGGLRIQSVVSLRDLPATLSAVAGLPNARRFPGQSLERYWTGPSPDAGFAIAELSRGVGTQAVDSRNLTSDLVAVVDDSLHVIREEATGVVEAYRHHLDPGEGQNIATSEAGRLAARGLLDGVLRREGLAALSRRVSRK